MTISIVGCGYVGLVTGAVFADLGHKVYCLDNNHQKILSLKKGVIPFFEPGLQEIVLQNIEQGRLVFTTQYAEAIPASKIVFICVGTPQSISGEANLEFLFAATEETARHLKGFTLVTVKSTVPIGIEKELYSRMKKLAKSRFELASCPEFLREGSAVEDTRNPDRIVIGTSSLKASNLLLDLYKHFDGKRITCDIRSAQMIKYVANSFLATKISFANAVANLSETLGADGETVLEGAGLDRRIGRSFLYPGVGYGGSCFPKDVAAFIKIAQQSGYQFKLLEAVAEINSNQVNLFVQKVVKVLKNPQGKKVAILGLSFKPNTDDLREAPSIKIINQLLSLGCQVRVYDPVAMPGARKIFGNRVAFAKSPYQAVTGTHVLLLVTEWNEFKEIDLEKINKLMVQPTIIDGRNIYQPSQVKALGFTYQGIGRS